MDKEACKIIFNYSWIFRIFAMYFLKNDIKQYAF